MILRFSVFAGRKPGQGATADADACRVVDVPLGTGEISIGRKAGSAIELPLAAVSASHARLFRDGSSYRVEDLGSANGTLLGSRRLLPRVPVPIAVGETLDVAGVRLRFDGELPDRDRAMEGGTDTLARRLVHDVFAACPPAESARLIGMDGPGAGCELRLVCVERALIVGRGESCDLILHDEDVSREHLAIERTDAGVTLEDLGSKNGVEVQGRAVSGRCRLRDGDVVRIGQTTLRLLDPEDRYLQQLQADDALVDRPAERRAAVESTRSTAETSAASSTAAHAGVAIEPNRLAKIATAVAVLALLWVVGLVLALAFGC
jgi:pSer/pThr/pTyr-binding forkhead associated (FHA) protein